MKFLCEQCKAKYQIADEKVAGKTVRMKCRKCGHLIEMRAAVTESSAPGPVPSGAPGSMSPPAPGPAASPGFAARPSAARSTTLAASFTASKPAPPPKVERGPGALAGAFKSSVQREEEISAPFDMSELSPGDAWYVAINGVPVGPVRVAELRRKAALGTVTEDSLVWQEGLDEWRPVRSFPELATTVREAASTGRTSATPPPPDPRGFAAPPPARGPAAPRPVTTAQARSPMQPPQGRTTPAVATSARNNVVPITSRLSTAERLDAPPASMATPGPFSPPAPDARPAPVADPFQAGSLGGAPVVPASPGVRAPRPGAGGLNALAPQTSRFSPGAAGKPPLAGAVSAPGPGGASPLGTLARGEPGSGPVSVGSGPSAADALGAFGSPVAPQGTGPGLGTTPDAGIMPGAGSLITTATPKPAAVVPAVAGDVVVSAAGASEARLAAAPVPQHGEGLVYRARSVPWIPIAMIAGFMMFGGVAALLLFGRPPTPTPVTVVVPVASAPPSSTVLDSIPPPPPLAPSADTPDQAPNAPTRLAPAPGSKTALAPTASGKTLDIHGLGSLATPSLGNDPGMGAAQPSGSCISEGQVEQVIQTHRGGVQRTCWERIVTSRPTANVTASLTIAADGSAQNVTASGGEPSVSKCVENEVRGWHFPAMGCAQKTAFSLKFIRQ